MISVRGYSFLLVLGLFLLLDFSPCKVSRISKVPGDTFVPACWLQRPSLQNQTQPHTPETFQDGMGIGSKSQWHAVMVIILQAGKVTVGQRSAAETYHVTRMSWRVMCTLGGTLGFSCDTSKSCPKPPKKCGRPTQKQPTPLKLCIASNATIRCADRCYDMSKHSQPRMLKIES